MKTNQIFLFLLVTLIVIPFTVTSQNLAHNYNLRQKSAFTENKGQITDQDGKVRKDVKYLYSAPGLKLVLKKNSFSYEVYIFEKKQKRQDFSEATGHISSKFKQDKFKETEKVKIHSHRVDISFFNSNPNPEIIAEGRSTDFNNYYLGHTSEKGVTNIYTFSKLTYRNLYPNIDFVFYAKEEGKLKYDIVVRPGGKLEDVKLKYDGMNELVINKDKLITKTAIGCIEESAPISFIEGGNQIKSSYKVLGNIVGFQVEKYERKKTLIIDPLIHWSTYYGGSSTDRGRSVVNNKKGEIIFAGYTTSTSSIASTGAYQSAYAGSTDGFIVKFNNSGNRVWATYFGGTNNDILTAATCDTMNNILAFGSSGSSSGIATNGSYQDTLNNGGDAFIVKFNDNGMRKWGTYFGGEKVENPNGICTDYKGNIFITGSTTSTTAISTSSAHQSSIDASFDGFVAKFDSTGKIKWSTYYGGSSSDESIAIATDTVGNVFITGNTYSSNGIATSGAHQSSKTGYEEVFIAKFNSTGTRQWGTYYIGNAINRSYGITCDFKGNVYITGETSSSIGVATINAHQSTYNGFLYDGFIAKFDNKGVRQWGTYYGGKSSDIGIGITCDKYCNLYIAGVTKSSTDIATIETYKSTLTDNYDDAFVVRFDSSGARKWGTYFGATRGDEYSSGISVDNLGHVFLLGYTYSSSGIATTNAYQTKQAGGFDLFLVKFPDCPVLMELKGKDLVCQAGLDKYTSIKSSGHKYNWTITGGIIIYGQGTDSIMVRWDSVGKGYIKIVETNTVGCKDSITKEVVVQKSPQAKAGKDKGICIGQSLIIGEPYTPGIIYTWKSIPSGFNSSISNPLVAPMVTTSYILEVKDSIIGCSTYDTILVTINPPFISPIKGDSILCQNEISSYSINGNTSNNFQWSVPEGKIIFGQGTDSILVEWHTAGIGRIKVKEITSQGCQDSAYFNYKTYPKPPFRISGSQTICQGESINVGGTSSANYTYQWSSNPLGFTSTSSNPIIKPNVTTIYYLELKDNNGFNCVYRDSIIINVNKQPSAYIGGSKTVCYGQPIKFGSAPQIHHFYEWKNLTSGKIISNQSDPIFSFKNSQIIALTEFDSTTGCINADTTQIIVISTPKADFSIVDSSCSGSKIQLNDKSFISNGSIIGFYWNFGDGDTSTLQNPMHIYSSPGIYKINLRVTSSNGCKDSMYKIIKVNPKPQVGFKTGNVCLGENVEFTNTSNINNGALNYYWSFGDGDTSKLTNPSHKYASTGTYNVKLKVWNSVGCTDSIIKIITINPLPAVSFSLVKDTTKARAYSFTSTTNAAQYKWSFGDGSIDSGKTVKHTYQKDSTYRISLAVIDSNGCTTIRDTTISIFTVGINELQVPVFNLKLYPNPFSHATTLEYVLQQREQVAINLFDITGKEISVVQKGIQNEGKYSYTIESNNHQLKAGIYILKVLAGNRVITRQLVKLKE